MPYKDREKQKEYQRNWLRKKREKFKKKEGCSWQSKKRAELQLFLTKIKLASGGCKICGEKHPACLEFHHRNPEEKDICISDMIRNKYSQENILKELEKCDILCRNCHMKIHWYETCSIVKENLDLLKEFEIE